MDIELTRSACGHTEIVKVADQEAATKAAGLKYCKACYASFAQRRADAFCVKEGLPPLLGSGKQIAWGRRLQFSLFQNCSEEQREGVIAFLKAHDDAGFYLDNRAELRKLAGLEPEEAAGTEDGDE